MRQMLRHKIEPYTNVIVEITINGYRLILIELLNADYRF